VIDGLLARADLNGSIGVITSYSNEQQRWIIMVDGEPKKLAMKEERLEVLAQWSWATGTDTWRPYDAAICARLEAAAAEHGEDAEGRPAPCKPASCARAGLAVQKCQLCQLTDPLCCSQVLAASTPRAPLAGARRRRRVLLGERQGSASTSTSTTRREVGASCKIAGTRNLRWRERRQRS
jgi:hypothetical protein